MVVVCVSERERRSMLGELNDRMKHTRWKRQPHGRWYQSSRVGCVRKGWRPPAIVEALPALGVVGIALGDVDF